MNAVIVFVILSTLLVAGKILRVQIPLFQRLYLPSSIVGGLLGLTLISAFGDRLPDGIVDEMRSMPGFLINVIFATLFLGGGAKKAKSFASFVLPQLTLAQIVVWGQYVVGLGLTPRRRGRMRHRTPKSRQRPGPSGRQKGRSG